MEWIDPVESLPEYYKPVLVATSERQFVTEFTPNVGWEGLELSEYVIGWLKDLEIPHCKFVERDLGNFGPYPGG